MDRRGYFRRFLRARDEEMQACTDNSNSHAVNCEYMHSSSSFSRAAALGKNARRCRALENRVPISCRGIRESQRGGHEVGKKVWMPIGPHLGFFAAHSRLIEGLPTLASARGAQMRFIFTRSDREFHCARRFLPPLHVTRYTLPGRREVRDFFHVTLNGVDLELLGG